MAQGFEDMREADMRRTGGGIFIAIGLIGGAIAGVIYGQPSVGLIGGLVAGLVIAGGLALWEMRR
jgi:hypothetical protein